MPVTKNTQYSHRFTRYRITNGVRTDLINNQTAGGSVTYGDNLPDWKKRLINMQDATTGLTGSDKIVVKQKGGYFAVIDKNGDSYAVGGTVVAPSFPSNGSVSGTLVTEADNSAKQKFSSRLASARATFSGGTFAGELRETLSMLRNPALGMRRLSASYLKTLKKGKAKYSTRDRIRFLSEQYLEYAFGLVPLISDCEDAYRALTEVKPKAKYIAAKGSASESNAVYSGSQLGNGPIGTYATRHDIARCEITYRGVYQAELVGGHPGLQPFGINPVEFIPTAWNLAPWSFLADYFLNIGDILEAASYGRTGLSWSNRTQITQNVRTYEVWARSASDMDLIAPSKKPHKVLSDESPDIVLESRNVHRGSYNGNFVPTLEFKVPGLGSQKWVNIAALIGASKRLTPFY